MSGSSDEPVLMATTKLYIVVTLNQQQRATTISDSGGVH